MRTYSGPSSPPEQDATPWLSVVAEQTEPPPRLAVKSTVWPAMGAPVDVRVRVAVNGPSRLALVVRVVRAGPGSKL